MLFMLLNWSLVRIYILAAIIPAVFLLVYIYRLDTVDREPGYLLLDLLGKGVLAALCAIVAEEIGQYLLNLKLNQDSPYYKIAMAFLVVAVAEEGFKFLFLKLRTWQDPNFNYRFDGVVYAAFVSLGFAAFENIGYVFKMGLGVSLSRAVFAIPGHLSFSIVMGTYYGRAKLCEAIGDNAGKIRNLVFAYLSAVFLHGFYDSCAMIGTDKSMAVFFLFVVVMFYLAYRLVRKDASTDTPV